MEYILMELFGGGTADWNDISQTYYDWEDIFDRVKEEMDLEDVGINDLYRAILHIAQDEFIDKVETFIETYKNSSNEEYLKVANKLADFDINNGYNWDIWCNCLDTHINLIVDNEELKDIFIKYFEEDLQEIERKIGFGYINIES